MFFHAFDVALHYKRFSYSYKLPENRVKIAGCLLTAIMGLSFPLSTQAQQLTPAPAITEALESAQNVVVTARRFHLEPTEFLNYEYAYTLNNGKTVRFSRRVGRFYVAIKGYEPVEILSLSSDQFVSRGGATLMFTEAGDALTIDNFELLQEESGSPILYMFGTVKQILHQVK